MRMKRWFYASLAVLAVGEIVAPLLFHTEAADFSFEDFPGWESIFGLISCVVIIKVSKLLGKLWLMRRETYYDS